MKFWNWVKNEQTQQEELRIEGYITDDDFYVFYMDVTTPCEFREELDKHKGDITVWINSYGGECVAASCIYTMLKEHKGKVTVKIDGIAASAASVIAMAGDTVLMSPTAMMMIHDPMIGVSGNTRDLKAAIEALSQVKESIINAYQIKTGLSRAKISRFMEEETWFNARAAFDNGFVDSVLYENGEAVKSSDICSLTRNKFSAVAAFCDYRVKHYELKYNGGVKEARESSAQSGVGIDILDKNLNLLKMKECLQ